MNYESLSKELNHTIPQVGGHMAATADLLSEKVQWHIRIFEAKSKRFKMLIKNVGKKVHRILAYHKPEVATFLWNDVKNDGYCRVTKSVRFL